ncbi:hypothetical protein B0H11DRAFT_2242714 [Mycena galericulata]|nr:hypothetical protein B0H11DRAFT_2242714 [Mycena galericulata]
MSGAQNLAALQAAVTSILNMHQDVTARVLAVNTHLDSVNNLAAYPVPLDPNVLLSVQDMVASSLSDPLHFQPGPWVAAGILIEDTGDIPQHRARNYVRIATIPADAVQDFIAVKMREYPADLPWYISMMLSSGIERTDIIAKVQASLDHYHLATTAALVGAAINDFPPASASLPPLKGDLTLCYWGVTITTTPLWRLEDDLWMKAHSRFSNVGHRLKWRCFHIPAADTPAPDGALAFRRNPRIGQLEALFVNASRGLALNTTPGGTWTPRFKPQHSILATIELARSSAPPLPPPQPLLPATCIKIKTLLNSEYRYWKKCLDAKDVCVWRTLESVKHNICSPASIYNASLLMVTVAEDITEEERSGKVQGIETDTAGPAMKENLHCVRLLSPLYLQDEILRRRGPFVNLFRLQQPQDRASHLAFLTRILTALSPVIISPWSNTIHRAFAYDELCEILGPAPSDKYDSFMAGDSSQLPKMLPPKWHPDLIESRKGIYIDSIGMPVLSFHGRERTSLHISIPNLQPGTAKHDPTLRAHVLSLHHLVLGAILEPAKALVAIDLVDNGPLNRNDVPALTARLEDMRSQILTHMENSGVMTELQRVKGAYTSTQTAVKKLRSLRHSNIVAGDDTESSTCSEEEDDDDDRAPRQTPHSLFAASGAVARELQLQGLEEALAALHGRNPDPYRYAPREKPIGTPDFQDWFRGLRDGQDIQQSTRVPSRSDSAGDRQRENQLNIGKVSAEAGAARRQVDQDDGLTERMRVERTQRGVDLKRCVQAISNPRKLKNVELLNTYRRGDCDKCGQIVIGTSKNSIHHCSPALSDTITFATFPNRLERITFLHDILDTELESLLGDDAAVVREGLVQRRVCDVLDVPANITRLQSALPRDHGSLDRSANTFVYLPKALEGNEELWTISAVDAMLRDQCRCPAAFAPKSSEDADAWREGGKAAVVWAKARFTANAEQKNLALFRCSFGAFGVTSNIKSVAARPQFFLHVCGHGRNEIAEHHAVHKKDPPGYRASHGPRSCPNQYFYTVESLLDLPTPYARFLWLNSQVVL